MTDLKFNVLLGYSGPDGRFHPAFFKKVIAISNYDGLLKITMFNGETEVVPISKLKSMRIEVAISDA